jgi:hypothetical protein
MQNVAEGAHNLKWKVVRQLQYTNTLPTPTRSRLNCRRRTSVAAVVAGEGCRVHFLAGMKSEAQLPRAKDKTRQDKTRQDSNFSHDNESHYNDT